MAAPGARTAKDAVLALLNLPPLTVRDGDRINDSTLPLPVDAIGRVKPYAVLWAGGGQILQENLAAMPDGRQLGWQVTAAGADADGCMWAADKVLGALVGARLTIPDGSSGVIYQVGDPGPARVDTTVDPHRTYLPLLFTCRLAALA